MTLDLKDYYIGIILVGLFSISIFSFLTLLTDNNTEIINLDTSSVDLSGIESQLNSEKSLADNYTDSFTHDNPKESQNDFKLFSVISTTWGIMGSIVSMFGLILKSIHNTLGIPPIVTITLSSILLVSIVLAGWKLIKTGK